MTRSTSKRTWGRRSRPPSRTQRFGSRQSESLQGVLFGWYLLVDQVLYRVGPGSTTDKVVALIGLLILVVSPMVILFNRPRVVVAPTLRRKPGVVRELPVQIERSEVRGAARPPQHDAVRIRGRPGNTTQVTFGWCAPGRNRTSDTRFRKPPCHASRSAGVGRVYPICTLPPVSPVAWVASRPLRLIGTRWKRGLCC